MPQTMTLANSTLNHSNFKAGSVYQVTAPRKILQRQQQEGSSLHTIGSGGAFRPVSPSYNHHIYMEIDPIYAHTATLAAAANEVTSPNSSNLPPEPIHCYTHSDIQLSDISDDDLRLRGTGCFASASSGGSSANSRMCSQYAEERPLIRSSAMAGTNMRQSMLQSQEGCNQYNRQCMTSQRNLLRLGMPLQVTTLSAAAARAGYLPSSQFIGQPQQQNQGHNMFSDTPVPIAVSMQGGEQYVSLQIDQHNSK